MTIIMTLMMVQKMGWAQIQIIYLHSTCSSTDSWILLSSASFVPWQVIFTPFMSWLMFIRTWVEEILPPHKPGWFVTPPSLIKGIPSLYQLNLTGGLLELESQNRLASVPAVNALGSTRIFKVSGKTVKSVKNKSYCLSRMKTRKMGEKHHHNDDDNESERKKEKFSLCLARKRKVEKKVADRTE